MEISLQFDHHYKVEEIWGTAGYPNATRKIFYPGASEKGGKDGHLLKIIPATGETWIGSFAPFNPKSNFASRVMSCPDPNAICVISSGAGYIVRTDNPSDWQGIPSIPVCDARSVLDKHLLVFSDFTNLVAYGAEGLKWKSPQVSSDGIRIINIADGQIAVEGWDAAQQKKIRISVDVEDGPVLSGSTP